MPRLYSNLADGSGRRYYFGLDSAPGGETPNTGAVQVIGLQPTIFLQTTIFRTPAPALITINSLGFLSGPVLTPAPAAIALNQLAPGLLKLLTITPSIPAPDYSTLPDNAPTILFIQTVSPDTALVTVTALEFALTQGGNIGFVDPGVAIITLSSPPLGVTYGETGIGQINVVGLEPTLQLELVLDLETAEDASPAPVIQVIGHAPTLTLPFRWTTTDAPPAVIWTTTTDVAA